MPILRSPRAAGRLQASPRCSPAPLPRAAPAAGARSPACSAGSSGRPGHGSARHGGAHRDTPSLRRALALALTLASALALALALPLGQLHPGATSVPSEAKGVRAFLQGRTTSPPPRGPWLHMGTGRLSVAKTLHSAFLFLLFFLIHLPYFTERPHFQVAAALEGKTLSWPRFTGLGHLALSFSSRFLDLDTNQQPAEDRTHTLAPPPAAWAWVAVPKMSNHKFSLLISSAQTRRPAAESAGSDGNLLPWDQTLEGNALTQAIKGQTTSANELARVSAAGPARLCSAPAAALPGLTGAT